MMHRLRRYDVFRFAQNDVAPVGRNDEMFAQCAVRHTSFAQRTSLGEAVIICRRQTSFKKRTFVDRQKCVFCWSGLRGSNPPPRPWQGRALPNELNPQIWCLRSESNQRHGDFQSPALPTELQRHIFTTKWRPEGDSNP